MRIATNGAVFHTSAKTIDHFAGHSPPPQTTSAPLSALTIPSGCSIQPHITALTAVGSAQGSSTAARTMPRPRKARCITSAMPSPIRVSSTTLTAVKKTVLASAA